jgi:fatty acid desaturase
LPQKIQMCLKHVGYFTAETTVSFSAPEQGANLLLGGLNFQVEHHLFSTNLSRQLSANFEAGRRNLSRVWNHLSATFHFSLKLLSHFRGSGAWEPLLFFVSHPRFYV